MAKLKARNDVADAAARAEETRDPAAEATPLQLLLSPPSCTAVGHVITAGSRKQVGEQGPVEHPRPLKPARPGRPVGLRVQDFLSVEPFIVPEEIRKDFLERARVFWDQHGGDKLNRRLELAIGNSPYKHADVKHKSTACPRIIEIGQGLAKTNGRAKPGTHMP